MRSQGLPMNDSHELAGAFPVFKDWDGSLGVLEFITIPFSPRRLFWIYNVPISITRANHAHKTCHQLLICIRGTVAATTTNASGQRMNQTLHEGETLHVPPLNWLEITFVKVNSILLVVASERYDPNEYIRSFEEFLNYHAI